MSWTACERCGKACREYGPLCEFCDPEKLAQMEKENARTEEIMRLKREQSGRARTGKAKRRGTRGAFGGRRK